MENTTSTAQSSVEPGFIASYMNISIPTYCVLWFVTLGFYSFYFQHKLSKLMINLKMDGETEKLLPLARWNLGLRCIYLFGGTLLLMFGGEAIFDYTRLFLLAAMVIEVMWSFKARNILSFHAADKYKVLVNVHGIILFFFPGLSLVSMFNNIEKEAGLLKIMRNQ